MFCPNCGKQIPDGTRFCTNCGAQLANAPTPQAPEKKKTPLWVSILVGVVAFALAFTVSYGFVSGEDSSDRKAETPVITVATEAPANPDYEAVFTRNSIVDIPSLFFMLDSAHFVSESEEGTVEKLEFGYEGDLIKEMVNVVYLPMGAYTEEEKAGIDAAMKETFSPYEAYDFVTIDYQMGNLYYVLTLRCTDLEDMDNIKVMQEMGFTEDDSLLSMKVTEEGLLKNGYIKR